MSYGQRQPTYDSQETIVNEHDPSAEGVYQRDTKFDRPHWQIATHSMLFVAYIICFSFLLAGSSFTNLAGTHLVQLVGQHDEMIDNDVITTLRHYTVGYLGFCELYDDNTGRYYKHVQHCHRRNQGTWDALHSDHTEFMLAKALVEHVFNPALPIMAFILTCFAYVTACWWYARKNIRVYAVRIRYVQGLGFLLNMFGILAAFWGQMATERVIFDLGGHAGGLSDVRTMSMRMGAIQLLLGLTNLLQLCFLIFAIREGKFRKAYRDWRRRHSEIGRKERRGPHSYPQGVKRSAQKREVNGYGEKVYPAHGMPGGVDRGVPPNTRSQRQSDQSFTHQEETFDEDDWSEEDGQSWQSDAETFIEPAPQVHFGPRYANQRY